MGQYRIGFYYKVCGSRGQTLRGLAGPGNVIDYIKKAPRKALWGLRKVPAYEAITEPNISARIRARLGLATT